MNKYTLPLTFIPSSVSTDKNKLLCFLIPLLDSKNSYGFPIVSTTCAYDDTKVAYTISIIDKNLPAGLYLISIYNDNPESADPSFTFPSQSTYENLTLTITEASVDKYKDYAALEIRPEFTNISIEHVSLACSIYDIIDVNFSLPITLSKASKDTLETGQSQEEVMVILELDPNVYGERMDFEE